MLHECNYYIKDSTIFLITILANGIASLKNDMNALDMRILCKIALYSHFHIVMQANTISLSCLELQVDGECIECTIVVVHSFQVKISNMNRVYSWRFATGGRRNRLRGTS